MENPTAEEAKVCVHRLVAEFSKELEKARKNLAEQKDKQQAKDKEKAKALENKEKAKALENKEKAKALENKENPPKACNGSK